ncbi:uncharacterized protein LOC126376485 [Pectinophora gossypiella]|uniref:uncharacterized protein LOC126376485 n=1 Tax=Pectinophora gossypiella TaxID=13191 RepID=UPI00214E3E0F|nr:uncharacterized protein LOC126376485 [Pectinophora gossypiella]
MSKKLKDLKWESVAVEGFPVSFNSNFQGFVGLEECTNYGLDKDSKRPKKKKAPKKRKNATKSIEAEVPNKKVKLSNGFVVENCEIVTPSLTNEDNVVQSGKKGKKKSKNSGVTTAENSQANANANDKKNKQKLGEDISQRVCDLTPEDMLTWAEFKLPEPILKALAELGFKKPTIIQELTLPAAIHGRRDILGAAETGSGKTLAFGLPILTGIMKLKEKAAMGLDAYDIPYKKTSNKKRDKKPELEPKCNKKNKKNIRENNNKKQEVKAKESSEDGYSSGEDSTGEVEEKNKNVKSVKKEKSKKVNDDDEFIEEIEVPVRKRRTASEDEGNNSDDSDNYIHLSDMLESDDLADSSDDEKSTEGEEKFDEDESDEENIDEENSDEEDNIEESVESDEDNDDVDRNSDAESGDEMIEDEVDENEQGIGCVKVIDNIDMPGQVTVKTGKPLYALILTPTRELAIQISRHLIAVAKYTGIRVATVVGGMASVKQERVLRSGPEVVVATPGRLWELVTRGQPHLQQLHCVKFLAIDETDRMVERAHFQELHPLLERLNAEEDRRSTRQNFVFSATLTMVHDLPKHMQGKKVTKRGKIINRRIEKMTPQQKVKKLVYMIGMTDPKVVDITQQNLGTAETLTESRITCSMEHKDSYLYYILKRHPGRAIVFCNSIGSVRRLAQLLTILKCRPLPLHANMQQRQRLKNLERFRDDPHGVLVATDVAARGLDIPDVDHVIHYQVPRTAENYVHRSGRTARATKEGLTILMMEPAEAYTYAKLCRTLNRTSEVPMFPVQPAALAAFRDAVQLARDIDALELKRRRAAQAAGWREKAARDMDIIIDDDVPEAKPDLSIDKALKAKKRQLDSLLTRPMFPKGFSYKYPTLNDPTALTWSEEKALQVMKNAIVSGELKKEKRKSKNAPLLKLEKALKKN